MQRLGLDLLVPGSLDDPDEQAVEVEVVAARARERDVADVRRIERAAEDADAHGSHSSSSSPSSTSAPRRTPAAFKCLLELVAVRRRADDAKAAVRAEDPERSALGRGRMVVEELRQLRDRLVGLGSGRAEREERVLQLGDPGARRARDAMDRKDPLVLDAERRRLRREVGLVEDDDLRALVQPRPVERELPVDRRPALVRIALGAVDHVDEQPRPLEVREKVVAEADALARPLDQTGDVGDGELRAVLAPPPCRGRAAGS